MLSLSTDALVLIPTRPTRRRRGRPVHLCRRGTGHVWTQRRVGPQPTTTGTLVPTPNGPPGAQDRPYRAPIGLIDQLVVVVVRRDDVDFHPASESQHLGSGRWRRLTALGWAHMRRSCGD